MARPVAPKVCRRAESTNAPNDAGQSVRVKEFVQRGAGACCGWRGTRGDFQAQRKNCARTWPPAAWGPERHAGFAQQMVAGAKPRARADGHVRQNQIHAERRQLRQQGVHFVVMGDDRAGRLHRQCRLQQRGRHKLGHRVGNAHRQLARPRIRPELDGLQQLAAEREDVPGILVNKPADFRQDEGAAPASKSLSPRTSSSLRTCGRSSGLTGAVSRRPAPHHPRGRRSRNTRGGGS